jgi:hypothetical protein
MPSKSCNRGIGRSIPLSDLESDAARSLALWARSGGCLNENLLKYCNEYQTFMPSFLRQLPSISSLNLNPRKERFQMPGPVGHFPCDAEQCLS